MLNALEDFGEAFCAAMFCQIFEQLADEGGLALVGLFGEPGCRSADEEVGLQSSRQLRLGLFSVDPISPLHEQELGASFQARVQTEGFGELSKVVDFGGGWNLDLMPLNSFGENEEGDDVELREVSSPQVSEDRGHRNI